MTDNSMFAVVKEQAWLAGLRNMMSKENHSWWGTRAWLVRSLIWLVLVGGLTFGVIVVTSDPVFLAEADAETLKVLADKVTVPLDKFFEVSGVATAIGIVILAQDMIIGEKQSGTATWVLSKPVSRSAFVLSKLLGNLPGILVTMVLVPGTAAYMLVSMNRRAPMPLLPFLGGLAVLLIALLFYFTLTLMLGTCFNSRGAAVGIPLALIIGSSLIRMMTPLLFGVLPHTLTMGSDETLSVALALSVGKPLPSLVPVIACIAWIMVFMGVSIWHFRRQEF